MNVLLNDSFSFMHCLDGGQLITAVVVMVMCAGARLAQEFLMVLRQILEIITSWHLSDTLQEFPLLEMM